MISWSIKILKSKNNSGNAICVGVAPSDINQNKYYSYKCGWYFHCYSLTLYSGPPHNYKKEYGPRKEYGKYVHTRDSVGIVMDTTKGELSFVLDGVNLGVAYGGIPLQWWHFLCYCVETKHRELRTKFILKLTLQCWQYWSNTMR